MSIKKGKDRIILTLPENQIKWIRKMAKQTNKTPSKFIAILLARKVDELYNFMKFESNKPSKEDLDKILEIIHTRWLED